MTPVEHRADPSHVETVERIVDAAERVFRHYGYSKTTVADIAKELGMSTANIYRFFSSKVEIHQALCARMLGDSMQLAIQIAARPVSATDRLREFSLRQYQFMVERMLDQEKVHEMVLVAIERDWDVIDRYVDELQVIAAGIIAEGIAAGEFRNMDPAQAAQLFFSATISLHHPMIISECTRKSNRASPEDLTDFALRALRA
ncbi:TetR family transcriptional regulator [Peteryoungia desertarenae]|nr:TetR family transcriptional regulator [Peteryoungia desertarenae]